MHALSSSYLSMTDMPQWTQGWIWPGKRAGDTIEADGGISRGSRSKFDGGAGGGFTGNELNVVPRNRDGDLDECILAICIFSEFVEFLQEFHRSIVRFTHIGSSIYFSRCEIRLLARTKCVGDIPDISSPTGNFYITIENYASSS